MSNSLIKILLEGNHMTNNYSNDFVDMQKLGLSSLEQTRYHSDEARYNKAIRRDFSEAKKRAKKDECYVCKKQVSSFCKSHSVPQFCLKRIAVDGKVFMSGIQKSIPYLGDDTGVGSAGTFQIICRECDNTIFQQYENPLSYDKKPTTQMLAQIAMNNYLQMIYKREFEQALYYNLEESMPDKIDATGLHLMKNIDLDEYVSSYNRAKIASNGHHEDWYYLCYYSKLNYTVPIAFQGQIALICDFDNNIINDIYNPSSDYKTQDINIAVFPLENESVVFAFIDSRYKRYKRFYKRLNSLKLEEQLSVLNYIIFKYSENVFVSKSIPDTVLLDSAFINVCSSTSDANVAIPLINPLQTAVDDFDLSKHSDIPNLLGAEYAI